MQAEKQGSSVVFLALACLLAIGAGSANATEPLRGGQVAAPGSACASERMGAWPEESEPAESEPVPGAADTAESAVTLASVSEAELGRIVADAVATASAEPSIPPPTTVELRGSYPPKGAERLRHAERRVSGYPAGGGSTLGADVSVALRSSRSWPPDLRVRDLRVLGVRPDTLGTMLAGPVTTSASREASVTRNRATSAAVGRR